MNETKKTILFLMNGFGMEEAKSFNVYAPSLMPNLDRITHAYPFTSIYASGTEAGLNKKQIGNFKSNYLSFSTEGKILRKEDILDSKINSGEISVNPTINDTINYVLNNNSRLHILFSLGNKYSDSVYKQLKDFCDNCINKGIKEIYLHLFLGDNTNSGQKTALTCINSLKYHVIGANQIIKIAVVGNKKLLTDESTLEEKKNFYRMIVSGIGEIWTDYVDIIERKYKSNLTDDNVNSFLVRRENVIKDKDSVFFFNYDNNLGQVYTDMIQNNHNYFPAGKLPLGVKVNSLFQINNSKIPFAYQNEMPETYFLEHIPEEKKVLVLASKERIGYVVNSLNGFRKEYKNNLNVLPIEVGQDRFNMITKYLLAYQEQNLYDLIIVDYNLMNEDDKKDIPTLKKNMNTLDSCLGAVYNKIEEKDQNLIVTSLYGEFAKLNLVDREMVNINFSSKTPLTIAGKGIDRDIMSFKSDCSITDLASLLYSQLGVQTKKKIFGLKGKNKGKKTNTLLFGALAIMIILLLVYYVIMSK